MKNLFIFLYFFILSFGLSACAKTLPGANLNLQTNPQANLSSQTSPQTSTQEGQISLVMTGDALIHSRVYKDAKKGAHYDFSSMLSLLKPIISQYDLAFYNQESVLGGKELGLSSYPNFNSPQEFGQAMLDTGFNLVSLANNHSFDRGEEALIFSLKFWQKSGAIVAGAHLAPQNEPQFHSKNGIKFAFLAYTYGLNGHKLPQGKDYLVDIYSKEKLAKDIKAVRGKADLIIISMHWGKEYEQAITPAQQELAHFLASQGAHIIIGTHPHVLQRVERIGNTLVFYSLGNFLSSQIGLNRRIGVLASVIIRKKDGRINISEPKSELLYVHYEAQGKHFSDFKVYPFSLLSEELLPGHKKIEKKYQKVLFDKD